MPTVPLWLALSSLFSNSDLPHLPAYSLHGTAELYALDVTVAGDVDGDGFDDVLVLADLVAGSHAVYVHSGVDGALLYTLQPFEIHPFASQVVDGAGDVNGDGYADIVIGSQLEDAAYVYSGIDGSVLHSLTGLAVGDGFGRSVAGVGDVNGDGVDDFLVGAVSPMGSGAGYARVFSGLDGSVLLHLRGKARLDQFGSAVAGAGDLNGDGLADVMVGAPGDGHDYLHPGFPPFVPPYWTDDDSGAVTVFSGADGSELLHAVGDEEYDALGWSVSAAGDVNGDSYDDVIAGSFSSEVPGAEGYARVFSGLDGTVLYTFRNGPASQVVVSGGGDLDGDGASDLLVSSLEGLPDGPTVHAYSGADGSELSFDGSDLDQPGAFRISASGPGDFDGDGTPDFVVGVGETYVGGGFVLVFTSLGPAAEAIRFGCGTNPPDSIAVTGGLPIPGRTVTVELSDPSGTMGTPSQVLLYLTELPDPAHPCGTILAGQGLSAPGARGERLVDWSPPSLLRVLHGAPWTGSPVLFQVRIPNDPARIGTSLFLQGKLIDAGGRVGLTDAVELRIGTH